MEIDERKFYNILKGQKIGVLSEEVIDILVKNKIIVKVADNEQISNHYTTVDGKPLFEDYKNQNSTHFESMIFFNKVEYKINEELLKEIYFTLEYAIINIEGTDEWDENEIEIELAGIIENEEKLKYLQNKHFALISTVKREPEYLVFIGKKEFNGYSSWEEMIMDNISYDNEIIIDYLTNDFKIGKKNIYVTWLNYYRIKSLSDYCLSKIEKIKQPLTKENNIPKLDTSKQVLLIEYIRNIGNWDDLSANKKGLILHYLLGKNKDNIKDIYLMYDKKSSNQTSKFVSDQKFIEELIKSILG